MEQFVNFLSTETSLLRNNVFLSHTDLIVSSSNSPHNSDTTKIQNQTNGIYIK